MCLAAQWCFVKMLIYPISKFVISLVRHSAFRFIIESMLTRLFSPPANNRHSAKAKTGGFTLLEMMIALAVFGLAALALIRLSGYTTIQTARLDDRLSEEIVAENLAAELLTDPQPPSLGEQSGEAENLGRRFFWTREVSADAAANILRIKLAVGRSDLGPGEERPPFRMELIRRAQPQ
jgi:general secretion pathway protein I